MSFEAQGGDISPNVVNREGTFPFDGVEGWRNRQKQNDAWPRRAQSSHSMVMGEGSQMQSSAPVAHIWQNVVLARPCPAWGGSSGGCLMSECFQNMQKYQIRCQRLELQLQNLKRNLHETKSMSIDSWGESADIPSRLPGELPDSKMQSIRELGQRSECSQGSANSRGDSIDFSKEVELEDALDKERQRRFELTAQLQSWKGSLKHERLGARKLVVGLSEVLGGTVEKVDEAAGGGGLTGEEITFQDDAKEMTLTKEKVVQLRALIKMAGASCLKTEKSYEVAEDDGNWRPYVLQEAPGSNGGNRTPPVGRRDD